MCRRQCWNFAEVLYLTWHCLWQCFADVAELCQCWWSISAVSNTVDAHTRIFSWIHKKSWNHFCLKVLTPFCTDLWKNQGQKSHATITSNQGFSFVEANMIRGQILLTKYIYKETVASNFVLDFFHGPFNAVATQSCWSYLKNCLDSDYLPIGVKFHRGLYRRYCILKIFYTSFQKCSSY